MMQIDRLRPGNCELFDDCNTCRYAIRDAEGKEVVSCNTAKRAMDFANPKSTPSITELAAEVKAAKEERESSETVHVVHDPVDHPAHYTQGGIETIQVIEAWGLGYNLGNTVKYISRAGKKDPSKIIEDLKKARWYLDREIKKLTREEAGE